MAINSRRWPWWVWTIIMVVLVGVVSWSFAQAYRIQGRRGLALVLGELEKKNQGAHPADLLKLSPPVDEARQEAAWQLLQRIAAAPWADATTGKVPGLWLAMNQRFAVTQEPGSTTTVPLAAAADLAAFSAADHDDREAWKALLAKGPVLLSGHGWLRQQMPKPEEFGIGGAMTVRQALFVPVRSLARAFAVEAYTAGDPRAALADLDSVVAAMRPCMSMLDAAVLGGLTSMRDDAWLDATIRGTDPAPWIADRPDLLLATADGIGGERMMVVGGLHQDFKRGADLTPALSSAGVSMPAVMQLFGVPAWRYVAGYDLAFAYTWEGRFEERLRGLPADVTGIGTAIQQDAWRHPLSNIMIPNMNGAAANAITLDTRGRRLRVAAAIIHGWQASHGVPADGAALSALLAGYKTPTDLLGATVFAPAIGYTMVAPGRFRLWSEPATNDLLPAGEVDKLVPGSGPWSHGKWWMDVDLNQITGKE